MFRCVCETKHKIESQVVTVCQTSQLILRDLCFGTAMPGRVTEKLIRNNYHLHMVVDGEAYYDDRLVKAGDVFLMRPLKPHQLKVAGEQPFHQYWFCFEGTEVQTMVDATELSTRDILHVDVSHLFDLLHECIFGDVNEKLLPLKISGLLHLALASLPPCQNQSPVQSMTSEYVNRAMEFLRLNQACGVTIASTAQEIGISEKYLCKLFHRELNITPIDYLNRCRISQAETLLATTPMSVSEIARAAGFENPGYFSRFFRRMRGLSPSEYRLRSKECSP